MIATNLLYKDAITVILQSSKEIDSEDFKYLLDKRDRLVIIFRDDYFDSTDFKRLLSMTERHYGKCTTCCSCKINDIDCMMIDRPAMT